MRAVSNGIVRPAMDRRPDDKQRRGQPVSDEDRSSATQRVS
ncbi:hypothetical protein C7S15_5482 [Burkholderia cepacia]|nr:hypothetical protein [Burkholderia cepacia]